jgi:hypothetical protein
MDVEKLLAFLIHAKRDAKIIVFVGGIGGESLPLTDWHSGSGDGSEVWLSVDTNMKPMMLLNKEEQKLIEKYRERLF